MEKWLEVLVEPGVLSSLYAVHFKDHKGDLITVPTNHPYLRLTTLPVPDCLGKGWMSVQVLEEFELTSRVKLPYDLLTELGTCSCLVRSEHLHDLPVELVNEDSGVPG